LPRSLSKAVRNKGRTGEPLPQPLTPLRDLGFIQRRGQLSLWVAAPGGGKSLVALHMVLKAGVPALYFSADTDRADQGDRAMCLLAGADMEQVKTDPEKYLHHLDAIPKHIQFEFESTPKVEYLIDASKAYRMIHGHYPHLIVVDTIGKVWSDSGDETIRNKEAVESCQELARMTGAHVIGLHHASKGYDSGDRPIPLEGLMSGTSKVPEQVVSMWRDAERTCFAVTKNRSGPADATAARVRAWVDIDFGRMAITEAPKNQIVWNYADDPELTND
jgi:hypothetical protein